MIYNRNSLEQQYSSIESSSLKAAYQGKAGSYSERACDILFPDNEKLSYADVGSACDALRDGKADVLVLPLENSTAGIVNEVYDRILQYGFTISKSLTIPIRHCLLTYGGAALSDIEEVYSHQQALDQCSDFIRNAGFKAYSVKNTAFAAEYIAEQKVKRLAAIGSKEAAAIYGLSVLEEDISDAKCNQTKFVVLNRSLLVYPDAVKISIAFTLPHESGALVSALSVFSYRGLNLTKIQSRPLADKPWEYCFYLDFQAKRSDNTTGGEAERAIKAIDSLNMTVPIVHFLGWYPEL